MPVERAEASYDFKAYYMALRAYLFSIPDAHVMMSGDDRGIEQEAVGGGFGVVVMKLDDGEVVAARVSDGGPAAAAGMRAGARIIRWGGKPVIKAMEETSTLLAKATQATHEERTYEQLRFLVRAPAGSARAVTFKNRGETINRSVALTAIDDNMETLDFTNPFYDVKKLPPQKMLETKVLQGNVGYVKVLAEADLPPGMTGDHTPTAVLFKNAIDSFINNKASGIVVDVRGNLGGDDAMVAQFLSSFCEDKTLYEYGNWYNAVSGKMEIWLGDDQTGDCTNPGTGLYIEPGETRYSGPVVALVNTGCVSSGEGVAMGVKNLPEGRVTGFWGTNGSFGMSGDTVKMPGELTVSFPYGQSLDKNKVVQIDSRDGVGGVSPNPRLPMTLDNAIRWGSGQDVVLEHALSLLGETGNSR